jgi:hypothetical protein
MNLWSIFQKSSRIKHPALRKAQLRLEALESRLTPYSVSGNAWIHPNLLTISFVPDGTNLGGVSSNLTGQWNGAFGSSSAWQNVILKAAQSWAQQTNLNFSVITDGGGGSGTGSYQQGASSMGDIRIGGFNFNNPGLLALGYMPPPVNNYSLAGDMVFNTAQVFNINGLDYDVYTVALHEFGHALGLNHSANATAVMYSAYAGVVTGLAADDIAGIRNIYSGNNARSPDSYDASASNGTSATASNITSTINQSTLTAALSNLDITTTSDVDYYKFAAPSGGTGQLTVKVQSSGLSLLAPCLKIYDASQTLLGSATGTGNLGSTVSKTVSVTAGQTYYVRVAGANTTAFGTGAYGLTLNFGSGSSPTLSLPNNQTLNGSPLSGGGGVANATDSHGNSVTGLLSGQQNDLAYVDGMGTGTGDVAEFVFVLSSSKTDSGSPQPDSLRTFQHTAQAETNGLDSDWGIHLLMQSSDKADGSFAHVVNSHPDAMDAWSEAHDMLFAGQDWMDDSSD